MRIARPVIAAMLWALPAAPAPATPAGTPAVYVMRHLQRIEEPLDSLTRTGHANACRLARWFGRRPLRAIHVRRFVRTADTAAPLARLRGLTVQPFDTVEAGLAHVAKAPRPALVVGNSRNVQRLITGLGGDPPAATPYAFGTLWIIHDGGRTTRVTLPATGPACEGLFDARR